MCQAAPRWGWGTQSPGPTQAWVPPLLQLPCAPRGRRPRSTPCTGRCALRVSAGGQGRAGPWPFLPPPWRPIGSARSTVGGEVSASVHGPAHHPRPRPLLCGLSGALVRPAGLLALHPVSTPPSPSPQGDPPSPCSFPRCPAPLLGSQGPLPVGPPGRSLVLPCRCPFLTALPPPLPSPSFSLLTMRWTWAVGGAGPARSFTESQVATTPPPWSLTCGTEPSRPAGTCRASSCFRSSWTPWAEEGPHRVVPAGTGQCPWTRCGHRPGLAQYSSFHNLFSLQPH